MYHRQFRPGDLVWFDPGVGYVLPGEVTEYHTAAQVITVQAVINNVTKTFTLNNLSSVKIRQDLGSNGVEDMIVLSDLNEASILWNLRIRYDNSNIYTYIGNILVAVNPYRMFDFYGLDAVSKYEGKIIGTLPPHLFAVGASAYHRLLAKDGQNQVILISGESGAGKTESSKLLVQYLAAVNKSSSNLITEQILEASPLLESFGNAKTVWNDNSSRFGKYLEILYKDGLIFGAKLTTYLLEKSRVVGQAPEERNFHVFYELLSGSGQETKERLGLMTAEKYFYLNQGGSCKVDGKSDSDDWDALQAAMQVLGFTLEEKETVLKILASILHLGNIYFHRKQLRHGQEGVEIGSDVEIKWTAHLLQLNIHGISRALVTKTSEARGESAGVPLNIDQALDARDAIAKALYSSLFTWIVARLNKICGGKSRRRHPPKENYRDIISILDFFGFEDFPENSFEQLCINFANENLHHAFNRNIFKLEQAEYAREKIEWTPIPFVDNQPVLHMMAKKPVGIFHLLDDESNFPKASDLSFLEKCHYNHALNELYSRPRMSSMEFGIKHFAGQVWYNVEGFLDKNRDTLRYDVMGLLISSKDKLISKMFLDLRNFQEASKTFNSNKSTHQNGHFVTMKPRAPTVAARFQESLSQLLQNVNSCNPFYIRCIKPNSDKCPMKFDMPVVLEQLRYTGMLETIRIRKQGYPVRLKYLQFAHRYRCLLQGSVPRGAPTKELSRVILDRESAQGGRDLYALGASKVFLREALEKKLEKERQDIMEVEVLKLQRHVRGYLARKRYHTMKKNAVTIQSHFRGYRVRKDYVRMRKGVVTLQAIFRMRRERARFGEMKEELQRRRELERLAREEQRKRRAASEESKASKRSRENLSSKSSSRRVSASESPRPSASRTVASINHLDVPAELAFILSKLDKWEPPNTEKNLAKVSGDVAIRKEKLKLPSDIDYYVFSKVANVYFKSHLWQMKRDPIKTPFLSKAKDSDYEESLAIFKLILRFMNDERLGGIKEKVLCDYIVNKGLCNDKLRDEIFCQLANQTWRNENVENCERGWILMSNCLSAFAPSKMLHKYLLKYVSDHAYNGFKGLCQHKLIKAGKTSPHVSRKFPPTVLEWRANKKRANMALEAKCSDGYTRHTSLESFTTAEEFCATVLGDRGVPELRGWTVAMEEGDTAVELNGDDFLLDVIGEIELPPTLSASSSPFLVTEDRSRGQLPLLINTGPHNNPRQFSSGLSSPRRYQRARSQDRLLLSTAADAKEALSRSALNGRYFDEDKSNTAKSRSLDNLLRDEESLFGLSESRLNRRYHDYSSGIDHVADEEGQEDIELAAHLAAISEGSAGASGGGAKIPLSKTPINERYFSSQPDLDRAGTADPAEAAEQNKARSHSNVHRLDLDRGTSPVPKKSGQKGRSLHGHPRHVKGQKKAYDRSSAMSDTSEAPSLASHVRRVRVPSQASDVDQFLDDLFMPVLDGSSTANPAGGHADDGLSDARSLAASMKGGRDNGKRTNEVENEDLHWHDLAAFTQDRSPVVRRPSILTQVLDLPQEPEDALTGLHALVSCLRGGGKDSPKPPKANNPSAAQGVASGFQPIAGLVSPTPQMMSPPPPMLMPTPVMPPSGGPTVADSNPQSLLQSTSADASAMAFTYVPVPVYNMGGLAMGQAQPVPHVDMQNVPPAAGGSGSRPGSSMETQQHQLLYQQAFLQNAVAQNMQIQQQLMLQNQALSQLLQQQQQRSSGSSQNSSMQQQFGSLLTTPSFVMTAPTEQQKQPQIRRASADNLVMDEDDFDGREKQANLSSSEAAKQRSKSTPNTPKISQAPLMPTGWDDDDLGGHQTSSSSSSDEEKDKKKVKKTPSSESIGKLKLSNEMKEKLEAISSRKSSMRSVEDGQFLDEDVKLAAENGVKKLAENRKLLQEQKLGSADTKKKWDSVHEVEKTVEIPEAPKIGASLGGPPPPPPPPLPPAGSGPAAAAAGLSRIGGLLKIKKKKQKDDSQSDASSPYSPDGSLPRPNRDSVDRRESADTERTEKFEIEESSEFLQPVDSAPRLMDPDGGDYATLEQIRSVLHPQHTRTYFAYNRVDWNLNVRKEVFSPSEVVNSPLAINLIFCQIVRDVFSPLCIRLTTSERSRMKTLLDEYDVDANNVFNQQHKLSTKKNIIEMAKDFSVYFARLYPVSTGVPDSHQQYLAITHNGVKLVKRQKGIPTDHLAVLETYSFEDIGEVSTVKQNGLQLVMHQGARIMLNTDKAGQIKDLLNQYLIESSCDQYDYARALADFSSRDESTLNFRKGDVIAVVPKRDAYTEKGWLYGIKDGHYGLFPSDFVERMSPQTIRREMRVIAKVTRSRAKGNSEDDEDSMDDEDEDEDKRLDMSPDYSGQEDNPGWEEKQHRAAESQQKPQLPPVVAADEDNLSEVSASAAKMTNDGKNPLLEYAISYFREKEKFEMLPSSSNEESVKVSKKKSSKKKKNSNASEWTWKDQVEMVKWTDKMINNSLLRLEPSDVNKMALECFACIMRYMGDLPLLKNQHEVDCVNTILMYCHRFDAICDEVYCQIMKQTTNNKSAVKDSCQKGWRLFSIVAAYFSCSELLRPFLFKYLETAAYDKRRAFHGTALVCLHNLRKTFKFGGRKNVPSIEEITAISVGRSSKRQIYRLPGGTERVINTKSTTVVENIISELCTVIGVEDPNESEEFSLYCIVEGETFTVPLAKEHYILDVTTELQRDGAIYYLIFCRSVWYYPLRLDNTLYIEVVFNQIAPDYLEGLLLVMPGEQIEQEYVYDISKVAALLHRAADMDHKPTIKETKFLLPKPALSARDIKPPQWVNMVQSSWEDIQSLSSSQAKAQVLEILSTWSLFGSSFFAVRRETEPRDSAEHIMALNKNGVSFLDLITHETLFHYPYTEVISTRKVQTEDGTLYLDMKCGNLMQQRITRIQTEQANEIARLIRQYITIDQRIRGTMPPDVASADEK